jgi:hypothetical protein
MKVGRGMSRMLVVGAVVAVVAALFAVPAQAAGGYYRIVNYGSGLCAEVNRYGAPWANGELVVQRVCDGSPVQQWAPVNTGGGVYEFVNAYSGDCMDVRNGVNADTTVIQQWECRGSNSMKWTINPNSFTGVHQIVSQTGGRCLDVRNGALWDGAQIQIYHCTGFGNSAQVWYFAA